MLTEEILKQSTTFKDWITGKISLIHNCYSWVQIKNKNYE